MRFEHVIEINSPASSMQVVVPVITREQLWRGLMIRVKTPQRFPMGPDVCVWTETEPGVYARTIQFGSHVMKDEVRAQPLRRLQFTPEPFGESTPIQLTMDIEEPLAGQMVLRFVYRSLGELTVEESYYSEYRHSAWLQNDRDMVRTLRQWHQESGLEEAP